MSEFVAYLHEVFAGIGPIQSRRMFGGHGIYRDGLMFGLVADDTLYLKADDASRADFESRGLPPFEYVKQGKRMAMSYYAAPEAIFDDPDEAQVWAQRAYAAALRAAASSKKRFSGSSSG